MQKEVVLCHALHWVSSAVFRNLGHVASASSAAASTGFAAFDSWRHLLVVPDRSSIGILVPSKQLMDGSPS